MPVRKSRTVSNAAAKASAVEHPSHYTSHPSGTECIEIADHFNFNIGNAVKYCWRAGLKNPDPKEDLEKAIWYIKRELERLSRGEIPAEPEPVVTRSARQTEKR